LTKKNDQIIENFQIYIKLGLSASEKIGFRHRGQNGSLSDGERGGGFCTVVSYNYSAFDNEQTDTLLQDLPERPLPA
jgi:hypothetical protein